MLQIFLTLAISTVLIAQNFDPEWKSIPKTFKGDNLIQVAKSLDTKKGEFESTDDFNLRLAKLAPSDKTFFFFCDEIPFDVKYDADSKVFNFTRFSWDAYLEIAKIEKNGKSYYGSNAFGVTRKIKELWNTTYALNDQSWERDSGVSFSLPCPPDQAPAIKKELGMAVLVRLVPHKHFGQKYNNMENPFLDISSYYGEATVSSPLEYISKTYILVCEVQKVIIFRKTDHSILMVATPKKAK